MLHFNQKNWHEIFQNSSKTNILWQCLWPWRGVYHQVGARIVIVWYCISKQGNKESSQHEYRSIHDTFTAKRGRFHNHVSALWVWSDLPSAMWPSCCNSTMSDAYATIETSDKHWQENRVQEGNSSHPNVQIDQLGFPQNLGILLSSRCSRLVVTPPWVMHMP